MGFREDSIALAMSWLKVDEARTEGRRLVCGMFWEGACWYEVSKELDDQGGMIGRGNFEEASRSIGTMSQPQVFLQGQAHLT